MISVTGWLPAGAYVKLPAAHVNTFVVVTPFCRRRQSPQFQHKNFKSCYSCKKKEEQDSPFSSSPLLRHGDDDDSPWESGDVWTNLALYLFTLHIPLSFGGLSVIALFIGQQPLIHPQTQAVSLLTIQVLEFNAALLLLKYTAKPQYKFSNFFKNNKLLSDRNWFLSSTLGFGFLLLLVCITLLLADRLYGFQSVSDPTLKEILLNNDISRACCVAAYCIVTPLLEEVVYRGFLLTSLSSTMKWQQAVVISSIVFSAIHFSGENFVQLFIVGCVLGCSYVWTGNLKSSIVIHSLYNALTLLITYFY